jgi:hypothetical protein
VAVSLDKVPSEILDLCEPTRAYRIENVQAVTTEWVELDNNHWLGVVTTGFGYEYGLYQFLVSDGDGANTYVTCVFRGSGTGDPLREMRHTWFAPDEDDDTRGYVFYLPLDATIKALQHLKKYFD